jgi:hypothetical protein
MSQKDVKTNTRVPKWKRKKKIKQENIFMWLKIRNLI